jgi:hypothetical protein
MVAKSSFEGVLPSYLVLSDYKCLESRLAVGSHHLKVGSSESASDPLNEDKGKVELGVILP